MAGKGAMRLVAAAIGVIAIVGLAGCGGDDGNEGDATGASGALASKEAGDTAAAERSGSSGPDAGSSTASTVEESEAVELTIGKTGWYREFAVTVDTATVQGGGFGSDVTLEVTYENLTEQTARPADAKVIIDGESISPFPDTPEVPGKGKAKGSIGFTLEQADLDEAAAADALEAVELVYGEASDNQTTIPLGSSAKVESVEPKTLAVTGQLTLAELIVDVLSGSVAPSYESGEKGKTELNLKIKISCSANCPNSGYAVDRSMFSVTGPGGLSAVADGRSGWCCDAIYPGDVSDSADNYVTFVVASPGTGSYTLTFTDPDLVAAGATPGTLAFTV
jgi:hypothetical protein